MSLSSLRLDAFVAVVSSGSFSAAAKSLHVTQSALSQRILNLEEELGSTLFVREPAGIRLTEIGEKLLRYCRMKDSLESEFLEGFGVQKQKAHSKNLAGLIKAAGFSTVMRSVMMPSLMSLIKDHPGVQLELQTAEMRELPVLLETGAADFILVNRPVDKNGIENFELGYEENVLVEAKVGTLRKDVYLDHDSEDRTTFDFFKQQSSSMPQKWKRSYLDEIYAIIDGVLAGAGRAVLPLHLAKQVKGLTVVKGYKPLKTPVYLSHYRQAYYTSLQKQTLETIRAQAPKYLKPS